MTAHDEEYRSLLRHSLMATGSCIVAVVICYFWVDRGVAFFVYDHHINKIEVFRWLTGPPPEVQNWAALMLTILIVRRAWGPFLRWQKVLLVACISLIVADDFRISLGDVSVGIGRRRGLMIIHRSSARGHMVSTRFSAATTSAVFRQGTPAEFSDSPGFG